MPCIANPKHHIQHAFIPLIFRTCFQPKQLLTTPLPWNISYPPHVDGKPADDMPPVTYQGLSAAKAPLTKIKRPLGEPGQKGEHGFSMKEVVILTEGMYEDLLVCLLCFLLAHISPV